MTSFLDEVLAMPRLVGERVSPDGRWLAWSWYGLGDGADVWVAPCDGSAEPIRLTATGRETMAVSWAPDSRTLVVGEDQDGDERVRLFAVDLDRPLELRALTEASPNYYLYGGRLAPDLHTLYYAANVDERGREAEAHRLYRHDLRSGARRAIAHPVRPNAFAPHLNHAGTHLLYTRKDRHPAGRQVWIVDADGRNDRELFNAGDERKATAGWFPEDDRMLVVEETATHKRMGVHASGATRWLVDDPEFDFEGAHVVRGADLVALGRVENARARTWLVDLEGGREPWMHERGGAWTPLVRARDAWVASTYSARQPRDIMRLTGECAASLTGLWSRTALRGADLAEPQDLRWRAKDGLEIQGWYYRARDARGTIVLVHGGPTAHSEDRFSPEVQFYVHSGFSVLEPNYRGSTGFGLAFREAIKADGWGGREQSDIVAGIRHLIDCGLAAPRKVGITGTSYGGYSSWCAITRFPPALVAAAAPVCGMTDLVVDYQTTRPDLRPYSEEMLGGSPETAAERYRERSPIHFVRNIRGRLLIVQGMRDPNVTPKNVTAVRAALDSAGVRHEILAFEDEGHGIMKPANRRILYQRLVRFFADAFAG
jgi:dipeptidyl aminopeptidase/acylaminoacyl peptidase